MYSLRIKTLLICTETCYLFYKINLLIYLVVIFYVLNYLEIVAVFKLVGRHYTLLVGIFISTEDSFSDTNVTYSVYMFSTIVFMYLLPYAKSYVDKTKEILIPHLYTLIEN